MRDSARERRESASRTSIIKNSMRVEHLERKREREREREREKKRQRKKREKVTRSLLSAHCGFVYDVRFPVLRIHTIITKCQACTCDLLCVTIRRYDTLDNDLRKVCALIHCVHTRMGEKNFSRTRNPRKQHFEALKQKCNIDEDIFIYKGLD